MSIETNTGKTNVLAGLMNGLVAAAPAAPAPPPGKRKRGRPKKAPPLQLPKANWTQADEDEAARLNREWLSVDNDEIWTEAGRWYV